MKMGIAEEKEDGMRKKILLTSHYLSLVIRV